MQKTSVSHFLLQIVLSTLLLISGLGAVTHGYTHLSEDVSQVSVDRVGSNPSEPSHKKLHSTLCSVCLAFAAMGAGFLPGMVWLPFVAMLAVLLGFALTFSFSKLALAFRARAPPVFS